MPAPRSLYAIQPRPRLFAMPPRDRGTLYATDRRFTRITTMLGPGQTLPLGWLQGAGSIIGVMGYLFCTVGNAATGESMPAIPIPPQSGTPYLDSTEKNIVFALEVTSYLDAGESISSVAPVVQAIPAGADPRQMVPVAAPTLLISSSITAAAGTWSSGGTPALPGLQTGAVLTMSSGSIIAGQAVTIGTSTDPYQESVQIASVTGSGPYTCSFTTTKPHAAGVAIATNTVFATLGNANAVPQTDYILKLPLTTSAGAVKTPIYPLILCSS